MCDMILPIESANKVCQLNAPLLLSIIYMSQKSLTYACDMTHVKPAPKVCQLKGVECVNSHRVCQLNTPLFLSIISRRVE